MTTTRSGMSQRALEHIVDDLLGAGGDPDHPARLIAVEAGCTEPADICQIAPADIDAMNLTDSNGDPVFPPLALKKKFPALLRMVSIQTPTNRGNTFWMSVTEATFKTFLVSPGNIPTVGAPPTVTAMIAPNPTTPADDFAKGSRRSVSDYKAFRDRKMWNQWNRHLLATGNDHGILNVFNSTYTPGTAEEIALFEKQEKFAFSVFTSTLQEATATEILRRYANPTDTARFGKAQALYANLCTAMTSGNAGENTLKSIENDLEELRLDKNWTKTVASFVTRVGHLIKDHRELSDPTVHTDPWYIKKLDETFSKHPEMSSYITTLKTQSAVIARHTGTAPAAALTYLDHYNDLMEHATAIDGRNAKNRVVKRNQNVNNANNQNQ